MAATAGSLVRGERRRLRRQESRTARPVEVKQVLCIRGGKRRDWTVLPAFEEGGRRGVWVGIKQHWLRQVLGAGRGALLWRGAVANLVAECVTAFHSADDGQASSHADTEGVAVDASVHRGRKRILDSDDEADLSAPAGGDAAASSHAEQPAGGRRPNCKRAHGGRRVKRGEFLNRDVRGMHLTFTVLRGPRLFVPVDGPWLQLILEHLAGRSGEPKRGEDATSVDFRALLQKTDRARVVWRGGLASASSHGSWMVRYLHTDGRCRAWSSGLAVPRRALSGEIYTSTEAEHAASQVLQRARRTWDRLDVSSLPRYDV